MKSRLSDIVINVEAQFLYLKIRSDNSVGRLKRKHADVSVCTRQLVTENYSHGERSAEVATGHLVSYRATRVSLSIVVRVGASREEGSFVQRE